MNGKIVVCGSRIPFSWTFLFITTTFYHFSFRDPWQVLFSRLPPLPPLLSLLRTRLLHRTPKTLGWKPLLWLCLEPKCYIGSKPGPVTILLLPPNYPPDHGSIPSPLHYEVSETLEELLCPLITKKSFIRQTFLVSEIFTIRTVQVDWCLSHTTDWSPLKVRSLSTRGEKFGLVL